MLQSEDIELLNGLKKKDPFICCLQEIHFRFKGTHKVRNGKVFYVNKNKKKAGVTILISDKIEFKTKTETRDKEEHCTMIK